jgi:hypothetical protein
MKRSANRGRQRGRAKSPNKSKQKIIGIIAEDASDVQTIDILIGKLSKTPYSIKSFRGNGCGKIAGKCFAWSESNAKMAAFFNSQSSID